MLKLSFLALVGLTVCASGLGCSTLPSASSPESADETLLAQLDAVELDGTEAVAADEAGAPKEMEVSWQDNGQPIRPMSAGGRGLPLKPPVSTSHKKGSIVAEDDKVPTGDKRKSAKKPSAPATAAKAETN